MTGLLAGPSWSLAAPPNQPHAAAASASTSSSSSEMERLFQQAQSHIDQGDVDAAFGTLSEIYAQDPQARGLQKLFESTLKLGVDKDPHNVQDRFGLASLLLDQERYEEALVPLREICNLQPTNERACSMLFRTRAACCHWQTYPEDAQTLVASLQLQERLQDINNVELVPAVHPFEALKWPCISLPQATQIAMLYARRAVGATRPDALEEFNTNVEFPKRPVVKVSQATNQLLPRTRKLRLGYISPDFTGTHPLAFLMQQVFGLHNRNDFSVHLYSLAKPDDSSPEVQQIRAGSDSLTHLSAGATGEECARIIQEDQLDILVDLCGHAGTSLVAQILSLRPAPIQVSYMGFPASSGAPYLDYLVCDPIVVPPHLRTFYSEGMIWMPHCYFVNSHSQCASHLVVTSDVERQELRHANALPQDGFVFCCHSRPDKIDPSTFETWLRALKRVREHDSKAVLWLLRSGSEMEFNLRRIAKSKFSLDDSALVFADICERDVHLRRLGAADLFLDTPAYNAHTLGCDTLFAGVPMISLLRSTGNKDEDGEELETALPWVATDKLASRVGASLLKAAGLDEMICASMKDYENLMVRCAMDGKKWYKGTICARLQQDRMSCPLFDTKRWVENLELGLRHIALMDTLEHPVDILIEDKR